MVCRVTRDVDDEQALDTMTADIPATTGLRYCRHLREVYAGSWGRCSDETASMLVTLGPLPGEAQPSWRSTLGAPPGTRPRAESRPA